MDFKQLNYITAIAKEQNITHAAEKLYITRSALNYCLLNTEKDLGVQLFKRLPNRLIPTYAGELYLEKAQQILTSYHELTHLMESMADSSCGRINLGITVNGGQRSLMQILPDFSRQYPGFSLNLIEGNVKFLEKKLLDGTIDLAWAGTSTSHPLLDMIVTSPLTSIRFAVSKEHPLVKQYHLEKKQGEFVDLNLFRSEMFLTMNKDTFVRPIIDAFFSYAGFQPRILTQCSRMDMVSHFISQGIAVGFLPESQQNPSLLLFPVKPEHTLNQTILFRKGQIFTEPEKYLIQLYLDDQKQNGPH